MRRIFWMMLCMFALMAKAQVKLSIDAGAHMTVSGYSELVMDTGHFTNNGVYSDGAGMFRALGGITFSGTGVTDFYYMVIDNAQSTLVDAPVSVHHTANLTSGYLDANAKLYLRSDLSPVANMEVYGVLENDVLGLVTRATVLSDCDPFTSVLSLNISGTAMVYQWQNSPDSTVWTDIVGATNSTHVASVVATAYYRCALTTNNSSYSQATPGVKLAVTLGDIAGDSVICVGTTGVLANASSGGSWSSSNPAVVTVGSASGVITGVSNGVAFITYTLGGSCFRVKQVTVGLPAITGTTNVCIGTTTALSNAVSGGTWSSASPYYATVDVASGVVTGVHVGVTTITYTVSSGCFVTTTVNVPNINLNISGGLLSCPGQNTTLACVGYPGGAWTSGDPSVATINASTGVMSGLAAGTSVITYTYAYCFKTAVATINPAPAPVAGSNLVCVGNTISLSCATPGGTWSSSSAIKATVDASGVVTGIASGSSRISYSISTGCASYLVVSVGAMPSAISGTAVICEGSASTLLCNPGGGAWSSSAPSVATITPASAVTAAVAGVATGIATISYTSVYGCVRTYDVTVNPTPGPIVGALALCDGSTSTLSAGSIGGTWISNAIGVATVGSSSGVVTGYSTGTANISYRMAPSCYAVVQVTVDAPAAVTGASGVCVGSTTTLTHPVAGGTWMSSNTARATVDAVSGVVTGITPGYVNIIYLLSPTCQVVKPITVNNNPSPILGPTSVCEGSSITLSSSAGGVWSIVDTAVATNSGHVVTGVAAGVTLISYVVASTGCYTTRGLTVNTMPSPIVGAGTICVGEVGAYTSGPVGGTWTSSAPLVGSVDAVSGVVTGRAGGGTNVRYTMPGGCYAVKSITVNANPTAISGTQLFCVGNTVTLSSSTSGAIWSISDSSRVAVSGSTATSITLTGVSVGTTNLSYTNANGCYRVALLTVNAAVAPIVGADTVCGANSVVFSNATPGGTWASSATVKATVGGMTGIVTGYAAGTAMISYTVSSGCKVWKGVTVIAAVAAITGATNVCQGSVISLMHSVPGGSWVADAPSIATVDMASGLVTGVSAGTASISYILSEGCYRTKAVAVKMLPVITGVSSLDVGAVDSFSAIPAGGGWATSAATIAGVNGYGVVSGVAVGSAIISYTAAGCLATSPVEIVLASSMKPLGTSEFAANTFSIFPNPSHGSLFVRTDMDGLLVVTTVDGKQALRHSVVAGVTPVALPSGLAAGVYFCSFRSITGLEYSVKLIFQP